LQNLQNFRKNLISVHLEKIPLFQWVIIILTGVILLITLSSIPSQYLIINSLLKAIFALIVILIIALLYNLNKLSFFEDKPIIIKIPPKVILRVTKAEEAVKGNTVAGASKEVLLETGFKLKVPLFIKKGDKLIINTETKDYVSRSQ